MGELGVAQNFIQIVMWMQTYFQLQFVNFQSMHLSLYLSVSSHLFRNIPSPLSHRILNFPISCHLNFRLWSEFELAFSRWAKHLLIEMDVIDVSFFSFDLICTHVEPTARSCLVLHTLLHWSIYLICCGFCLVYSRNWWRCVVSNHCIFYRSLVAI